jgi:DNA-binding MarR family transcriptional regulator
MSSINQKETAEQSFELLIKCMMQSKHRLIELGSRLGLTGMQAVMILLLDTPRPMNGFTKLFNCDASNVTGIVDGLEQKKLAARYPDENDRRIKMVRLSSSGKSLRKKLLNLSVHDQESTFFKLNTSELKTLTSLLQKITT